MTTTIPVVFLKLIQINRSRMFDYKEQCRSLCKSIIAVSDCLKIDHEEDVVFVHPVLIHMPIPNDIDDSDSELVIFRSRDDGEIELIPKRTAMLCPSSQNCYTFQDQSFSGYVYLINYERPNVPIQFDVQPACLHLNERVIICKYMILSLLIFIPRHYRGIMISHWTSVCLSVCLSVRPSVSQSYVPIPSVRPYFVA